MADERSKAINLRSQGMAGSKDWMRKRRSCPLCNGEGETQEPRRSKKWLCPACNGTGYDIITLEDLEAYHQHRQPDAKKIRDMAELVERYFNGLISNAEHSLAVPDSYERTRQVESILARELGGK